MSQVRCRCHDRASASGAKTWPLCPASLAGSAATRLAAGSRRARGVPVVGEPGSCPAKGAVLAEGVPPLGEVRPAGDRVLEPAERAGTGDGGSEPVRLLRVVHRRGDERLHVPVAGARALRVDPQPALVVSVILVLGAVADLVEVVERRLGPDLPGA